MSGIDLARRAACALITGVLDERQTLAEQIGAEALDGLSPSERARAQHSRMRPALRSSSDNAVGW